MEWKQVKLSEICISISDGDHSAPPQVENGIPFITISNITENNEIDFQKTKFVPQNYYDSLKGCRKAEKGDILYSVVGTFGKPVYVKDDRPFVFQRHIAILKPNEFVDNRFLYYTLLSPAFYQKADQMAIGAVQRTIGLNSLRDASICIPVTINDQRKITNILSSLDAKIENNNKINVNLEAQAAALFKSWFVDFEPFKDGEFVESELGMIPKGWKVSTVYDIVNIIYGAPYKSTLFNQDKNGLPLIRIRDLKDCSPQFYTPEILPKTEYVEYGDIVAGMDAEFTPYIWRGEKGLLNQRVLKIIPRFDGISRLFGYYLLKPELEFVQSYKVGTTVSHLGKADIDRFQVIIPPIEQIHSFSQIVDSLLERQITLDKENIRLSSLRDTLLPKLMSGEIDLDKLS